MAREIYENKEIDPDIRIYADWTQSAYSIWWQATDEDPEDESTWHSTPYQVADARHNRDSALELVSSWLES